MGTHTPSRALIKIGTGGAVIPSPSYSFLCPPTPHGHEHGHSSLISLRHSGALTPTTKTHLCHQHHKLNFFSRRWPPVVEVAATRDKKPLFVAPPRNTQNKIQGARRKGKKHRRAHQPVLLL
ncbi:hypothetical protein M405DRAFT_17257 [Rhizopogon salebrosus TDB-379]|nr:hypothetical protein M405DRAFT_17257 [Rhizopogon salebrosus TDB-379]